MWYRVPPNEPLTFASGSRSIPVGATVTITLPERYLLLGAALLYGLPLAALLLGAALGAAVQGSDAGAASGAGLALLGALLATRHWRAQLERALLRRVAVQTGG